MITAKVRRVPMMPVLRRGRLWRGTGGMRSALAVAAIVLLLLSACQNDTSENAERFCAALDEVDGRWTYVLANPEVDAWKEEFTAAAPPALVGDVDAVVSIMPLRQQLSDDVRTAIVNIDGWRDTNCTAG